MIHELKIPKGTLEISGLTDGQAAKLKELLDRFEYYRTVIAMFGYEIEVVFRVDKEAK